MTFTWNCPHCDHHNYYFGSKTTNVVVVCRGCGRQVKASSHKDTIENYQQTTDELPEEIYHPHPPAMMTIDKLTFLELCNYAINTIHNKKPVVEKDANSSWFQKFEKWSQIRLFAQSLKNDKVSIS